MKTQILSKTDGDLFGGANLAVTLDFNDVATYTTATAQAIIPPNTLGVATVTFAAGTKVQCLGMKLNTAFDITGTGALTVSVGDGGSATALMAAVVVALDGTEILYHVGGSAKVYLVADTVDVFFTDATSMAYTSGSLTLYFSVRQYDDLPI